MNPAPCCGSAFQELATAPFGENIYSMAIARGLTRTLEFSSHFPMNLAPLFGE
jgi:hypothetical protein